MSPKSKENDLVPAKTEEIRRIVKAAHANYKKYPNVVGIAAGKKFKGGEWKNDFSIQFFVSKKIKDFQGKKLPSFIFGRSEDGKVDRTKKYLTDVIDVGKIKPVACAGTTIDGNSEGTITLFFKNKSASDGNYYILTCSHVIAPLSEPISDDETITTFAVQGDFASVVRRSSCNDPYDIALAKVTDNALKQLGPSLASSDCKIEGEHIVLKRFFSRDEIDTDLIVDCRLGRSGSRLGTVKTANGGEGSMTSEGCTFQNLFQLDFGAIGGDSGGIVYIDDAAVGIVVLSDGEGTWFQPLEDAIKSLDGNIRCFP
ncbi:MAG: chymotrypsin family serine protease [Desulfobaccales bacterium]